MHKFRRNLITEWRKLALPFADTTIVIAVSGGADSLSLLHAMHDLQRRKKLDVELIVAHFNHNLRGRESDADERFVRKIAKDLHLEFTSAKSERKRKGNLEQNARDERYDFLEKIAREFNASLVLTAHTKNDQAETFLLNLIRGSGTDGLSGMKPVRALNDNVRLVRPLLSWATRDDTESYCLDHDLAFRTDRMNDDPRFTRVKVRRSLIPLLAEINPRIVDTLARTAELMPAAQTEAASTVNGDSIELRSVRGLPKPELYVQLRLWLKEMRGNLRGLQMKHIEAIERLIHSRRSGKTVELPGRGRVVKQNGTLVFSNIKVEK